MNYTKDSGYKSLIVWQKAYELTLLAYKLTKEFPREELYGLVSQIRRSSSSIPVNIAEGYSRISKKEYLQFLSIARGSCAELETLILMVKDLNYVSIKDYQSFESLRQEVAKMIKGLMNSLS